MSRIKCSSLLMAVLLALCAGMTSCKDDDLASDDHYKIPDWLKGNAYEVMQTAVCRAYGRIYSQGVCMSRVREIAGRHRTGRQCAGGTVQAGTARADNVQTGTAQAGTARAGNVQAGTARSRRCAGEQRPSRHRACRRCVGEQRTADNV